MKCTYCGDGGFMPFCPKCYLDYNGRPIVKDRKSEAIKRNESREKEERKELELMFRNMRKVNMTSTGSPATDKKIYSLFGEPHTWT